VADTDQTPEALVRAGCAAMSRRDVDALRPLFSDDVVYHNIPMEPAVGLEATLEAMQLFFGMFEAIDIKILALAVDGGTVLTERDDVMTMNGIEGHLPVMGTFEVEGGRIRAWRDYFDMAQVTALLTPPG
jgi:limonene-1,2-epoxide hydrolase